MHIHFGYLGYVHWWRIYSGYPYRLFHTSLNTLRTPALLAKVDICCSRSFPTKYRVPADPQWWTTSCPHIWTWRAYTMPHTEDIVWYCNLKLWRAKCRNKWIRPVNCHRFLMTRGLQFKIFICCLSTPSTVTLVYSGPGNYTKLPRTPWGRRMKRMAMCAGTRGINAAVAFGYPMGRRRSRIFVLREHISVSSR